MTTSYNGWLASTTPADFGGLDNSVIPGTAGVRLAPGVRAGDVATVFFYFAAQLHKRVQPAIAPGCWGFDPKMSANDASLVSCHFSATAFDYDAPLHGNGRRGTWTAAQIAEVRKIQSEVLGVVYWGEDAWGNGVCDGMHFEIKQGVTVAQVKAAADHIRALGQAHTPVVVHTPTPTPVDPNSLPTLSYGMRGSAAVAHLQAFCNAYDFRPALPLLPVTGNYLDQTAAVLHAAGRQLGVAGDSDGRNFGPHFKAAFAKIGFPG